MNLTDIENLPDLKRQFNNEGKAPKLLQQGLIIGYFGQYPRILECCRGFGDKLKETKRNPSKLNYHGDDDFYDWTTGTWRFQE